MSTRANHDEADTYAPIVLRDLVPARASDLPRLQHAVMSSGGGPPQARSVYYVAESGASQTYTLSVRVPPGVTDVDVEVIVNGNGTVEMTTSADATGTLLRAAVSVTNGEDDWVSFSGVRTNGVQSPAYGAEGRALGVVSSAVWYYQNVDVTVVVDASATADLRVYGLTFFPIHVPR